MLSDPNDYSIFAEIYDPSSPSPRRFVIPFNSTVHDFEYAELKYTPEVPISEILVSCKLVSQNGSVYFDNVAIQEKIPGN